MSGKQLATHGVVHLLLLAAFPVLLMHRPRYAFVAIALAIVLMYRQRVSNAERRVRRKYDMNDRDSFV